MSDSNNNNKKSISIGKKKVNPLHKLKTVREEEEADTIQDQVKNDAFFNSLVNEIHGNNVYIAVNAVLEGEMKNEKIRFIQSLGLPVSVKISPGVELDEKFCLSTKMAQFDKEKIKSLQAIGENNFETMKEEAVKQAKASPDHFVHASIIAQTLLLEKQFPSKDKLAAAKAIGNWHVEQFVKTMVGSDVQEKDMEKYRNVVLEGISEMFHSGDSLNSSGQGNNNNSNNTSNNLKNSSLSSTSPLPVISSSSALLDDILEIKSIPKKSASNSIYDQVSGAAILIQSVFKGYKVRKSISNYQYRKSSLMLQKWYRHTRSGHDERVSFLKTRRAIIKLQALLRGRKVRKEIEIKNDLLLNEQMIELFNHFHNAATRIQAVIRGIVIRKRLRKVFVAQQQVKAALLYQAKLLGGIVQFQARVRGYLMREYNRKYNGEINRMMKLRVELEEEDEILQGLHRSLAYWHEESDHVNDIVIDFITNNHYTRAAIKIQQLYRDVKLRIYAAGMIQSVWKGYVTRKHLAFWNAYATTIQKVVRGRLGKLRFKRTLVSMKLKKRGMAFQYYAKNEKQVVIVQNIYRRWSCMRNNKLLLLIVKVQRTFRRYQFQRQVKTFIKKVRFVKHFLGMCLIRRRYLSYRRKIKRRRQATIVSSLARKMFQRKKYLNKRQKVILMQTYSRRKLSYNRIKKMHRAATYLSSLWRCHVIMEHFQHQKKNAATIQKQIRGFITRIRLYNSKDSKKTHVVQLLYRRLEEEKQRPLQVRIDSATMLQSHFRMYFQRNVYNSKRRKYIIIQSLARRFHTYCKILRTNPITKKRYLFDGTFPGTILRKGNGSMTFDIYLFDGTLLKNVPHRRILPLTHDNAKFNAIRFSVGDHVDASMENGLDRYPGTITKAYPGSAHYDVLFEGDTVSKQYIPIENIFASYGHDETAAEVEHLHYSVHESVETTNDHWKTVSLAYIINPNHNDGIKKQANAKASNHHRKHRRHHEKHQHHDEQKHLKNNKQTKKNSNNIVNTTRKEQKFYSIKMIGSKGTRDNVPYYSLRKRHKDFQAGMYVEASYNSNAIKNGKINEVYKRGQILSVDKKTSTCEVLFRKLSTTPRTVPFSKIRTLRGKVYKNGLKVRIIDKGQKSHQSSFLVNKLHRNNFLPTRGAIIKKRGEHCQFYNVSFTNGKRENTTVHFSLIVPVQTQRQQIFDIVRVNMSANGSFTHKELLNKYICGITKNNAKLARFQAHVRRRRQRKKYQSFLNKVILLQATARRKIVEIEETIVNRKVTQIQKLVRARNQQKEYKKVQKLAMKIQSIVRLFIAKKQFVQTRNKVRKIQAHMRGVGGRNNLMKTLEVNEGLPCIIDSQISDNNEYNIELEDGTYITNVKETCLTKRPRYNEEWLKVGTKVDATTDNWDSHFAAIIASVTWDWKYNVVFCDQIANSKNMVLLQKDSVRKLDDGDVDLPPYKWNTELEMTDDRWKSVFRVRVTKSLKGQCYNVIRLDGEQKVKSINNVKQCFLRKPFVPSELQPNSEIEYYTPLNKKRKYSIGIIKSINKRFKTFTIVDQLDKNSEKCISWSKVRPVPVKIFKLNTNVTILSSQKQGKIYSRNKYLQYTVQLPNGKFVYRLTGYEISEVKPFQINEKLMYLPMEDPYRQGKAKMSIVEMASHRKKGKEKTADIAKKAAMIQSLFRSFKCRVPYLKKLKLIISVQTQFRRFDAERQYYIARGLVFMIQANYRMLGPRKQYKKMRNAAICIQSFMRGRYIREQARIMGVLASKIQRRYRKHLKNPGKEELVKSKQASSVRSNVKYQYNKQRINIHQYNEKEHIEAAVTIQKYIRRFLCENLFKLRRQSHEAAIIVQRRVRGSLSRKALWKEIPHTQDHEYDGYLPGTIIGSNKDGTFKVEFDFGQICNSINPFSIKEETVKHFQEGDRCEATEDAWQSYLTSTITNVYRGSTYEGEETFYDVLYDDGTTGTSIPETYLRHVPKFHHKLKLGEFVEVTKRHWEDRQVGYILDINIHKKLPRTYRVKLKNKDVDNRILDNVEEYQICPYSDFEDGCRVEATRREWNYAYFEGTIVNIDRHFGTFGISFDDGEYFENTELVDVRRRHFHLYNVGHNVLVKFDTRSEPFLGIIKSVTKSKSYYHIEFSETDNDDKCVEKIHVSAILHRVRKDWNKYDRVVAKLPGAELSFMDQVRIHKQSKEQKAKKMYAILLIQRCVMRWKARRKRRVLAEKKRVEQEKLHLETASMSKISLHGLVDEDGARTTKNADIFHKKIESYIEQRVEKNLERHLSSLSPNDRGQFIENEEELHHEDDFSRKLDFQIRKKIKQHIDKRLLSPSSSSSNNMISNYSRQNEMNNHIPNLLHINDFEKANSDNVDSLSTVTTTTVNNNMNNNNGLFLSFSMGDSVLATHYDWDEKYYPGNIAGINSDGTYSVQFLDGDYSSQVLLKHIKRDAGYPNHRQLNMRQKANNNTIDNVRNHPRMQNILEHEFKYLPGHPVLATNSDWDSTYFPGRVETVNDDGTYVIHFYDGHVSKNIHLNHIKDIPFKKDDRVLGKQNHWVKMHPGTIERLNSDGTYIILFDDGDSKDILLKNIVKM